MYFFLSKRREWDFFLEYGRRKATGIDATESTVIESAAHSYLEWLVLEYLQVNQIRAYSSLEIPTYLCYDSASWDGFLISVLYMPRLGERGDSANPSKWGFEHWQWGGFSNLSQHMEGFSIPKRYDGCMATSTNVDETLAGWRPASSNDLLGTDLCVLPVN